LRPQLLRILATEYQTNNALLASLPIGIVTSKMRNRRQRS